MILKRILYVSSKVYPTNQNELDTTVEVSPERDLPQQDEMPFAVVQGKALSVLPRDLYIPPDALEIILEAFEGPMDLLLYLIRRQNLDILEIDVAEITRQYMGYIQLMQHIQLELAADYLVMAAMLAEIKSRMLLPSQSPDEQREGDPRVELIKRLQEYERFKHAAEEIDQMPRVGRDIYQASAEVLGGELSRPYPEVELRDLLTAFAEVLRRAEMFENHQIEFETLSTRERMSDILRRLGSQSFASFESLFSPEEGRHGVVVTFLAVMELIKESLIDIVQTDSFGPIHVKAKTT